MFDIPVGHSLEEIRIRALDNILSKLRNGIICIEDLIHHRELFVNLLQWFNHENPAKIGQVLKLLEALSKVITKVFGISDSEFSQENKCLDKQNLNIG